MQYLAHMFLALCLIWLPFASPIYGMSLTMGLADGSYGEIGANAGFTWELGQSNKSGTITVTIQNNSQTIVQETTDPDGNLYNVYISPYITAFLFNVPDGVSASLQSVTNGETTVSGWNMPMTTMKSTLIPSPDYHGFWDAGASIGSMFTSGDPSSGIPMGETYAFEFLLTGDVALLSLEDILRADPFFSGPDAGGGGKKGGKASTTSDDGDEGDDGPARLDWEYYFLANVKGYPEGVVDFELLVPEAEINYPPAPEMMAMSLRAPAVATPEPSTIILLLVGLTWIAAVGRKLKE
ncbi:PEP-CTERM sorting domain-containing protein [Desulfovibrio mangrovi]|uniref:PEP-CTERM sorting domain-containing protein n=1 Tax=Desulfovibrio mangrovi TaxID=2976983 RepID=UPI00224666C3|nr:PEP-CTERM sorting domain-containing protein [Desulfovibrio mangrovi]UZP67266.1 PEP-CTERM sorting domain-containing protein [Desulfovibrio mangrovi]